MSDKTKLKEILNKIKEYETIIIHRHVRPDGDCIGTQMGLKEILKASFPEKRILVVGDEIPEYLSDLWCRAR
jgi:phosphoesterase RecJ-like protein